MAAPPLASPASAACASAVSQRSASARVRNRRHLGLWNPSPVDVFTSAQLSNTPGFLPRDTAKKPLSVGRGCAGPARVLSGIRSSFGVGRATAGLLPTLVGTGGSGSSGRLPSRFLVAVAAASLALTSASVRKDIAETGRKFANETQRYPGAYRSSSRV